MDLNLLEAYGTYGALGASFIMLMTIVWKWINSINPALKQLSDAVSELKAENQNYKGALDNNTKALEAVARSVDEVAKSNQIIADMVKTFSSALDNQAKTIDRHDNNSDQKFEDAKETIQNLYVDLKRHDERGERIESGVGKLKGVVEIQTEMIKISNRDGK